MKMLNFLMQPPEMLHASRFCEFIFTTALLLSQLYAYSYPASGAG